MTLRSASDDRLPPTNVRYGVLAFVCALSMVTYLDRVCFGNAAKAIVADLSLPGTESLKGAFTAFAIAYALFEIPAGWMGDRWGPRGTLIRIVIWWSVFTAMTGLVGLNIGGSVMFGLGSLIVMRFLFGAGEAGAYPNITRALHNWFPREQWETVQGCVWMSARLMGGFTPLFWAGLVAGTPTSQPLVTWRGAFLICGAIGLIWCIAFAIWFRNRPEEHPRVNAAEQQLIGHTPHADASHSQIPWRSILTNRSLWFLCGMYCLVNYGWIFNITYLASYLDSRFGLTESDTVGNIYKGAPLWVGAAGCLAGGFLVNGLASWLGDRGRARRVLCVTAFLGCAACWSMALVAKELHLFCWSIAAAAFCIDLTLGCAWATCQDIGQRHAAVTAAFMNTIGTLGSALAGWLTGTIVELAVGRRAAALNVAFTNVPESEKLAAQMEGYQSVFATYAAVYVAAAICWLFIDPGQKITDNIETS
jgi:MFS transporter, ACS family, glucarate transporter